MIFLKTKYIYFLFLILAGCNKYELNKNLSEDIRVVSFSPALTDFVLALGGENYLVGRTPWCAVNKEIPVVGDLFNIELEKLVHLNPTHILVQRKELKKSFSRSLFKLKSSVLNLPIEGIEDAAIACLKIGDIFPSEIQSKKRASLLAKRIRDTIAKSYFLEAESIGKGLIVSSSSSEILSWGKNTYLGEMMAARGFKLIHDSDAWKTINLELIYKLNPEWVLVVGDFNKRTLESFKLMKLKALESGRVFKIAHKGIHRPSSGLPEISEKLDFILGALFSD
tara:strand:+ start:138 stop:980 length:843 start_codon:yes stop_codon:yes gene_type:complete